MTDLSLNSKINSWVFSMADKKYYCSKHGAVGHPDCEECKEKLRQLCSDKNVYLTGLPHTQLGKVTKTKEFIRRKK